MADGQEVVEEVLEPHIQADLDWCQQWYEKFPGEFTHSWEEMRPRIIKRLQHVHREARI